MTTPKEHFNPYYAALRSQWEPRMPSDPDFVDRTNAYISQADTDARATLAAFAEKVISEAPVPFDPHESSLHPLILEAHAVEYARKAHLTGVFDPLPPL
jgi:hypothetical protein